MMKTGFELKIKLLTEENETIVRSQRRELRELTKKFEALAPRSVVKLV